MRELKRSGWPECNGAAIAGSHRASANVVRDSARHPYETLTFFGIRPTMTVVELSPPGGWYTEIRPIFLKPKPGSDHVFLKTGVRPRFLGKRRPSSYEMGGRIRPSHPKPWSDPGFKKTVV
jgi:hypothetical protein